MPDKVEPVSVRPSLTRRPTHQRIAIQSSLESEEYRTLNRHCKVPVVTAGGPPARLNDWQVASRKPALAFLDKFRGIWNNDMRIPHFSGAVVS
jgi:hypothetical protein